MDKNDWRDCVVAQARTWIGTRFHHQGRVKKTASHKGGVDCLGLLVGVARELELRLPDGRWLAELDEGDYSMLPDGAYLRGRLEECLVVKWTSLRGAERCGNPAVTSSKLDCFATLAMTMKLADILLMELEGNPQHVGMVSVLPDGSAGLIHAYAQARGVVEHRLDGHWLSKVVAVFGLDGCVIGEPG